MGIGNHLELQMVSLVLHYHQNGVRNPQNMKLGHNLAEVPSHHNMTVVVQGSLGHSPDNRLRGPRLMVESALAADVYCAR